MTAGDVRGGGGPTCALKARLADLVVHTTRTLVRRTPLNFDHAYGVDTERAVGEAALGIDPRDPDGRHKYEASSLKHFRFAIRQIPAPLDRWAFVDIGSGKGRIVLLAIGHPFRHVAGIEYDAELHAVAEANLARFAGPRRAATVALHCGDALAAKLPDGDVVVFFYNSFHGQMLEGFLDHLERVAAGRRLLFVYSNPTERHRVDRRPAFARVFEGASGYDLTWWGNRRLVVYALGDRPG